MLYRVEMGTAVFPITVEDGKVVNSAPIGRFMIGWSIRYAQEYITERNGMLVEMKEKE